MTAIILTISTFDRITLFSIAPAKAGIQQRQRYLPFYSKFKTTCS